MASFLRRNAVLATTGILLFLSGIMLVVNTRGARRIDPLGPWLLEILAPASRASSAVGSTFGRAWDGYVALVGVREENEWLRRRLREVEARHDELADLGRESERLHRLLELRDDVPGRAIAARVTSAELKGLFRTATLGKGERDGIARGMAVIAPGGVVGQVFATSPRAARVLLLEDQSSGVDALVQRTRARGIVEGGSTTGCTLKYVKRREEMQPGDRVVTSGLDGIFPKGLAIGEIASVIPGERGLFQAAEVVPAVDVAKLEEVLVVANPGVEVPPDAPRPAPAVSAPTVPADAAGDGAEGPAAGPHAGDGR